MFADINVEVIFVALVTEERVAPGKHVGIYKGGEPFQLALFRCKPPGIKIQIEGEMVHDVLLQPVYAAQRRLLFLSAEPGVCEPFPEARGHAVRQYKRIQQFREDEHFHV